MIMCQNIVFFRTSFDHLKVFDYHYIITVTNENTKIFTNIQIDTSL